MRPRSTLGRTVCIGAAVSIWVAFSAAAQAQVAAAKGQPARPQPPVGRSSPGGSGAAGTHAGLKLVCRGPSAVALGDQVNFTLELTNTGSAVVRDVCIYQIRQGGGADDDGRHQIIQLGQMLPGQSRVIKAVAEARQPGPMAVHMVAEADGGLQVQAFHTVRVAGPDLVLRASGPDSLFVGQQATYELVLSNSGDRDASNVNLLVGVPKEVEVTDATEGRHLDRQQRWIGWSVASLPAGKQRRFSITVVPRTEGEHLQRAVAWADGGLAVQADMIVQSRTSGSLEVELAEAGQMKVGLPATYRIRIANRSGQIVEDTQVGMAVPDGMALLGVTAPTPYRLRGRHIIFEPIRRLSPGEETAIELQVRPVRAGTERVRVEVVSPNAARPIIIEKASQVVAGDSGGRQAF